MGVIEWEGGVVLAVSVLLFMGATVLGAFVGGGERRFAAADACVGMGAASGIATLLGIATPIGLSVWATLLGLLATAAGVWLAWTRRRCGGRGQWLALVPLLPLLLIIPRREPSHWDEFTAWLHNAAYLYRYDSFPRADLPSSTSILPGYPYASPLFIDFASLLAGRFVPSAGGLLNVLLLSSCVAALIGIVSEIVQNRATQPSRGLSRGDVTALIGVGAPVVTVMSPSFDRVFTLAALPDAATAVAMAMCTVLAWLALERLKTERYAEAHNLALRFGFAAAFLINLKQSNVALFALLPSAFLLVAFRDVRLTVGRAIRLLPAMLGPGLVLWVAWHSYVAANVPGGQVGILPRADWHIDMLPEIVAAMGRQMLEYPLHFALMFALSAGGLVRLWFMRNSIDRLLAMAALAWLGYISFLLVVYVAVFNVSEATRAAEFARYSTHLGLVGTLTAVAILAWWWPGHRVWRSIWGIGLAGLVAFPTATLLVQERLMLTTDANLPFYADLPFYRRIGRDLADVLPDGARLAVLDPNSVGLFSFVLRYELARPGRDDRNLRVVWQADRWWVPPEGWLSRVAASFGDSSISHLVIVDPAPACAHTLSIAPEKGAFLLERKSGRWQIIRSWNDAVPPSWRVLG